MIAFPIKKHLFLCMGSCLYLALFACKKDAPTPVGNTLETQLIGTWNIEDIHYSGIIPNPLDPLNPIPATGQDTEPLGSFEFIRQDYVVNYAIQFQASVAVPGIGTLPFPVNLNGSGQWTTTSDGKKLLITETDRSIVFDVTRLNNKEQLWEGPFLYNAGPPLNTSIVFDVAIRVKN